MTISLENVARRSESMLKTVDGFPFPGTIFAQDEGAIPSYDFSEGRFIMRVRSGSPVKAGMVIVDPGGRHFITASHDDAFQENIPLYRSLRLYPANMQMKWQRETQILDPLTQLKRGAGKVDLGMIWALNEQMAREPVDLTLRIKEQGFRIITNAVLKENDILNDMVVRRIDHFHGVLLAELQ